MEASQLFYDKLVQFEGLKLTAYKDSAAIWTIGIGTIKYPDGTPVKKGDTCTTEQAYEYAKHDSLTMQRELNAMVKNVNQNQFDALLLLAYNIGTTGLRNSTVLKRVKNNPADPLIKDAWVMWNKAKVNGVMTAIPGLTNRRVAEYTLYVSK